MINFRSVASLLAFFCALLAVLWFFNVGLYTQTYGVAAGDGAAFFGRRVSPILLGLAVMLWMVRDAPPSPPRRAIAIGAAVIFAGVAFTGVYAYLTGVASFAILVAAATEVIAAAAFIAVSQDKA